MPDSTQPLTKEEFYALKHPLQRRRFALALFFALILFPLIGVALVAGTLVLLVPFFAFLLWVGGRIMFARFMGNSILVSELNYPRIYNIGEDLKRVIDYHKPVNIFVYEQGNFNAFLAKFFFYRRAVFLNSELLEAGVTDDELRWLIGRFIGYLKMRRQAGFWGWTIRAAEPLLVFNIFLLPYVRALNYSGDRIALAVINGDITSSVSAMQKLFVGRLLGYSVNPSGLVDQHRQVKGSFFAFLARMGMSFPHMTARYVDLISFAKERYPEQYARFEAENPGLPANLGQLAALPNAGPVPARPDPVWGTLAAAVLFLGLITLLGVKVVVPGLRQTGALPGLFAGHSQPADTAPDTTTAPPPPPPSPAHTTTTEDQTQSFTSTAGRFSVQFPSPPTQKDQEAALSDGSSATIHQFLLDGSNLSYIVMYNDYPAEYLGEPQAALGRIRDGWVKSSKATLVDDKAIDLGGVPGREYKFTDKDGVIFIARDLLDGQRLYQLIVTVSGSSSTTEAEAFLDSFRIL
jgi:nitrate reductase NapE component